MRTLKSIACAAAAASLAFGGVAHADATRSVEMLPKATAADRASAPAVNASQLQEEGGISSIILALLAGAAIIGGIVILADGDDDDGDVDSFG